MKNKPKVGKLYFVYYVPKEDGPLLDGARKLLEIDGDKLIFELDSGLEFVAHKDDVILKEADDFDPTQISLCQACFCMTHTVNGKCGKCGAKKENL